MIICSGIYALIEATPYLEAIHEARVAAFNVWEIIDNVRFSL